MTDPYAVFEDLHEPLKDYPGKRTPVNRHLTQVSIEDSAWDAKPAIYVYKGVSREFFKIGHLANALNRAPVTIRSWEKKGVLPISPYRTPAPRVSTVNGSPKGKRLWVRAQIEGILRIAREEGCIVNDDQSPPTPRFTARVQQLFQAIREQEESNA